MASRPPFEGVAAVAFDMFGTLVRNDYQQWRSTIASLVDAQALPIDAARLHREWSSREVRFRSTRGRSAAPFSTYRDAWRAAFAETFAYLGLDADPGAFADRCVADLGERGAFDDAAPALEALGARRLGVLSNADDAFLLPVIRRHGWRFEPVVSSEGAKAYKPDARIFAAYCALAGVGPGEVLYVGDSPYDDVHGAKESGMRAVWVRRAQQTPGRTPPPPDVRLREPDAVITSLAQLPALLP